MILHETSDQVVFVNKSAEKQFGVRAGGSFQLNFRKQMNSVAVNFHAKIFKPFNFGEIKTTNDIEKARAIAACSDQANQNF